MRRIPETLLSRFPVVDTVELSVARRETSRFWPAHESWVIGPKAYAVTINRVLLGNVAVTFVACTARLIVVPREPSEECCLVLPLTGSVEIDTGAGTYRAVPGEPLFRAPATVRRFEATPTRCIMVDVPMAVLRGAIGERSGRPRFGHSILRDDNADAVISQVIGLARMVDRSRRIRAIQSRSAEVRRRLLPRVFQHMERRLVEILSTTSASARQPAPPAGARAAQSSIEASLRRHALSGLPVAELARRAGVSARTLQRACEQRGYSPLDFVRGVQLDRAQELLSRATAHDTVAGVAIAVGLSHLGRFSHAYRQRFGELPSATLARAMR